MVVPWDNDPIEAPLERRSALAMKEFLLARLALEWRSGIDLTDLEDIFISHISSMDALARGLEIADDIISNSGIIEMRKDRYASFDSGNGAKFEAGELDLVALRDLAAQNGEPEKISGKQELYEAIVNHCICK